GGARRQQVARQAVDHLLEGDRLHQPHQPPQPAPERAQQVQRHPGALAQQALERRLLEDQELARLRRLGAGRVGAAVEGHQLGHGVVGVLHGEHHLAPAGRRDDVHPHPPAHHHVQPERLLARQEQRLAGLQPHAVAHRRQRVEVLVGQLGEHGAAGEDLGVGERHAPRYPAGSRHRGPCRTVVRWLASCRAGGAARDARGREATRGEPQVKPRWQRTLGVMFVAQLLASVGFSTIFPFLPNYVEHLGVRGGGSLVFWVSAVFSVQAVSMMFAAPIWGAVADRYGRKLMVVRSLIGGAVIILLMGFARSAEELTLLRLIQGLITGVMSASSSLVASVTPRERLGYAMGLMQTANWAGVSVGPMIGGVLEFFFGYRIAFVVTAALLLLGGVLV